MPDEAAPITSRPIKLVPVECACVVMCSFIGEQKLSFACVPLLDALALGRHLLAADHRECRQHGSDQGEPELSGCHG